MSEEERRSPTSESPEVREKTAVAADLRVERILEHIDDSLRQEDALQAVVGAAGGDLMLMQYRVSHALEKALQAAPDSLTSIAKIMPSFNVYTKLSRQTVQFVQPSVKLKASHRDN